MSKTQMKTPIIPELDLQIQPELFVADIGNFFLTSNFGIKVENRYVVDNDRDILGSDTLRFDEDTHFYEEGTFDRTYNKLAKKYKHGLLCLVAKSTREQHLNLILGLPQVQMAQKDQLIKELKDQEFEFYYKGERRTVKFHKVAVIKESLAAFYSLPAEDRKGRVVVLDIGGRTVNCSCFENGKEINNGHTTPRGTINLFTLIAEKLTSQGGNFVAEEIHSLFMDGTLKIEDFQEEVKTIVDYITNDLKAFMPNMNYYKINLVGGGAPYLEEELKKHYDNVKKAENFLTANIDGGAEIGKAKGWNRTECE